MLIAEAKWIGQTIQDLPLTQVSPLLNIGSSSQKFREIHQPWIDRYIFSSLTKQGTNIIHTDLFSYPGVDLVGNIEDSEFVFNQLMPIKPKFILCSNMLEHVDNRPKICSNIQMLVEIGTLLCVTVPFQYPRHNDPIDNMFRPTISQLAQEFPELSLVRGEIVACETFKYYLTINKYNSVKMMLRMCFPLYKPAAWRTLLNHFGWIKKRFVATCCIFTR